MNITVTIPNESKRILESWLGEGQIQPWLQHTINNKLRQRIDASILEETDKNPAKLSSANTLEQIILDKLPVLKDVTLPIREERDKSVKSK